MIGIVHIVLSSCTVGGQPVYRRVTATCWTGAYSAAFDCGLFMGFVDDKII